MLRQDLRYALRLMRHRPGYTALVVLMLAMSADVQKLRAQHFFSVIGRQAPGQTIEQARAEFDAIAQRQQKLYPGTNDQRGVTLVPLHEQIVGDTRTAL